VVAGIEVDPAEPGYKHIMFQPQPGGGLTYARATLDSPYGRVISAWELIENDFHLNITVPPTTHATVRLPTRSLAAVTEGGQPLSTGNGIRSVNIVDEIAVIKVKSGQYEFITTGLNLG
jgi:alpha-L-rhamnosidase